jgi:sulfide dehydrogenase cytochrome subunit
LIALVEPQNFGGMMIKPPPIKARWLILLFVLMRLPSLEAAPTATLRPSAEAIAYACAGCHGVGGHALAPTPSLAGKPEAEFIQLMRDFKSGQKTSSIMNRIARGYADEDFTALAAFFNHQK